MGVLVSFCQSKQGGGSWHYLADFTFNTDWIDHVRIPHKEGVVVSHYGDFDQWYYAASDFRRRESEIINLAQSHA